MYILYHFVATHNGYMFKKSIDCGNLEYSSTKIKADLDTVYRKSLL